MEYVSGLTWKENTKIVIGIDIGTTQSAVSIGLLEQGVAVNKALHPVREWPGQDPMSFGADATSFTVEDKAEDQKWLLAKHFKLHLHPDELRTRDNLHVETLPYGVTLEQVYTDFLRYLFAHTEKYFKDWIVDGSLLWPRYRDTMEFVIAHPNAWSTREQAFLRKVAIKAGLVNSGNASRNVRFVTEAEASVHYCLHDSNLMNHLKPGTNFAVCDAGGSTVDTTLYSVVTASPLFTIEEKHAPGCVQAGAIFVDRAVHSYIETALKRAELPAEDIATYCKDGMRDFEAHAKRGFRNPGDGSINIGNTSCTITSAGVRRGRMTVPNVSMKLFFDGCVKKIFANVNEQVRGVTVSAIVLVGGFGDSPYLRDELRKQYESSNCKVTTLDSSRPTSKAVADGAIIWSYSQAVVSRRPRSTFGAVCSTVRDLGNPEHAGRQFFIGVDGREKVKGVWDTITVKDVPLLVTSVNRSSFARHYTTSAPYLGSFETSIAAYDGTNPPYWAQSHEGLYNRGFRTECKVTADLQKLSGGLEMNTGVGGRIYWELEFDICIRFGGVELEAYIEWNENGVTRQGPVTVVPDQSVI
ncbi:unnamed protein product [Rhizoctonia solani]|uniref:Heat shock 70 kDa protein 12A n=1 Tax=Rhizoctonia solani TaxID=456999 RepID=A0A8H3DZF3_9AGAM|nr:unnamed protein product [Rhizoctonia solani]